MHNSLDVSALDIPFEYWIEQITFWLLCVMFRFSISGEFQALQLIVLVVLGAVVNHLPRLCWSTFFKIKFEMMVGLLVWHNGE